MFLDTKFRFVLNSQKEKTARSTSAISQTGIKGLTGGKEISDLLDYSPGKQVKEESALMESN